MRYKSERTRLMPALCRGGSAEYDMAGSAPEEPGSYILRVTLVQEGVRWLGELVSCDVAVMVV